MVGRGKVTCELDVDDSLFNCLFFPPVFLSPTTGTALSPPSFFLPRTSKGGNLIESRSSWVSWSDASSNSQMFLWASCCTNSPFTAPQPSPPSSAHRHRLCTSAVNFLQKASQLYLSLECSRRRRRRRSYALINVPACFAPLVYSETKVEKAPVGLTVSCQPQA